MLNTIAAAAAFFILAVPGFAGNFTLNSYTAGSVPASQPYAPAIPAPHGPAPVTPPGVAIAAYTTDETFSFESQAKPAMEARIKDLNAAGVATLGGRVVPAGNDYSFAIDYIPTVKAGAALPPAVLVKTYNNGASYWPSNSAAAAMNDCAAAFRAARLPVVGSYTYDSGGNGSFAVDYLVNDVLQRAPEYDVKFLEYTGGKFTFESEAKKNVTAYLSLFRQAGVPAIRGKAVSRPDGDYAVRVEYVVKAGRTAPRPQYSVLRYDAREVFPFEKNALAAGKAALPLFQKAGVPPLSSVSRPVGGDYSYGVDFLVQNFYQHSGVVQSAAVETYQAQETFTFDKDARKAMQDKAAAFEAAGLPVVGSAVTGELGGYTYALDYIAKAGQAPAPRP